MNEEIIQTAIDFKRRSIGTFQSITVNDINSKISGNEIIVTTKIDGEYNLLYFDGENTSLINSGGNIKTELPILDATNKSLKSQNIKSLKAVVELHTTENRSRIFELLKALKDDKENLSISAFDLLELNDEKFESDYTSTIEKLNEIFKDNVVISKTIQKSELEDYFNEVVINQGQEGLVIRSNEFPIVYKLKPVHTIDLAVIGYTEENEKTKELLLATMDEENNLQQLGIVGNGLDEEMKVTLFQKLSELHIDSQYMEVDKRRIAFHMVKPQVVVEVSVNELLTENSKGIIKKPLIEYSETYGYKLKSMIPSISFMHPIIKRIRDDKTPNNHDVRYSQITDIVYMDETITSNKDLPSSEVIFREVYTKATKGQTNVKKFLIIKTNKEEIDNSYPAYVFHYTDFSSSRKDSLKKDLRISNSKEQIEKLCSEYIEKDIKKGWNLVE